MAWGKSNDFKMCQSCRAVIPAGATACELCGAEGHYAARTGSGSAVDPLAIFGEWPMTMLLITANLAVYAAVLLFQAQLPGDTPGASHFQFEPRNVPDVLGAFGSISAAARVTGEWWRLLAHAFLHGGVIHLAMNTYALWIAGRMAEELWGRTQYIVIYVLSGLGGGLLVMAGQTSAVGASGALFGLIAALLVHTYRRDSVLGKGFQQYMLSWLLLGVAMSFSPRVSMAGHFGGAFVGAALALVLPAEEKFRQSLSRVRVTQCVAALCVLAVLVTAGLAARNLKQASEAMAIQDVSKSLMKLTVNVLRYDEMQSLAYQVKQANSLHPDDKKDFVEYFSQAPEKITDDEINQQLTKAQQAACSDIGTLERMAVLDAEIGQVQERMAAALRPGCAKAPLTVAALTAQGAAPPAKAERAPFYRAFLSYWQWIEKRGAQLQQPTNVILTEDLDAWGRDLVRYINESNEAAPKR